MKIVYDLIDATYAHDTPAVCKILDQFSEEELKIFCANLDMLYSTAKYHILMNKKLPQC